MQQTKVELEGVLAAMRPVIGAAGPASDSSSSDVRLSTISEKRDPVISSWPLASTYAIQLSRDG